MYYAYSHNRSGRCVSRIASAWDGVRGIGRRRFTGTSRRVGGNIGWRRLRTEFDDGVDVCRGVGSTAGFGEDVEIDAMWRLGIVEIWPGGRSGTGSISYSCINSTYSTYDMFYHMQRAFDTDIY